MKTTRYPNHHPIQQTIFKLDLGEICEMESWGQGDKGATN